MRFYAWSVLLLGLLGSPVASLAAEESPEPNSAEIIAQMLLRNGQRQVLLGPYSGLTTRRPKNHRAGLGWRGDETAPHFVPRAV